MDFKRAAKLRTGMVNCKGCFLICADRMLI